MIIFPWTDLSDDQFEELCKDILRAEGLENVMKLSGPGSGDMGRDIHAEESFLSRTGTVLREKILVQAKNYAGSEKTISPNDIDTYRFRAEGLGYSRLLIITSHDLSSPAKTYAKDLSEKSSEHKPFYIRIDYWNQYELVDRLIKNPQITRKYFRGPSIQAPFLIGILDGFVGSHEDEISPQGSSTTYTPDDWLIRLSKVDKLEVEKIHAVQINKKYDAIINPFGEVYPEISYDEKRTYRIIKDYIYQGGVFINAGGYPFFYCWDVHRGNREVALNIQRVIQTPDGLAIGHLFSDTLIHKDFRALLSGLDAIEIEVYQTKEDIERVGNIIDAGGSNKVNQFRAVRPETPNVIPLLRQIENKIYPIAAIPYGQGYLIVGGMNVVTSSEFEKLSLTVLNWFKLRSLELAERQS
jgi:hypothetical protein